MKKLIVLFFAAVLCFSLGACGSETHTNDNGTQHRSENTQTLAFVVHIVINPEFKIHVNKDGNVFDVECLNDDARAVNDKAVIVGKTCEDALGLIVKEAVNQGFMKDGVEIQVTVSVPEELANQLDVWSDIANRGITQALAENNLRAKIIFDSLVEAATEDNNQSSGAIESNSKNEDSTNEYSKQTDEHGNVIETYFRPDGTIEREIHTLLNGIMIEMAYDKLGVLLQINEHYPDGTNIQQTFFSNGTLQKETRVNVDGSWSEYTYGEDGTILQETWKNTDGSAGGERVYHASGILAHEIQYDIRGVHHENTYNEQGEILTENYITDQNIIKIVYEPAGVMKYKHFYNLDGSFSMTFLYDGAGNHVDILDENGNSLGLSLSGQGAGQ